MRHCTICGKSIRSNNYVGICSRTLRCAAAGARMRRRLLAFLKPTEALVRAEHPTDDVREQEAA